MAKTNYIGIMKDNMQIDRGVFKAGNRMVGIISARQRGNRFKRDCYQNI
jgi:hypothetical protein